MPSSRDLSSPTDVHSQGDASDKGIAICSNIMFFLWFSILNVDKQYLLRFASLLFREQCTVQ